MTKILRDHEMTKEQFDEAVEMIQRELRKAPSELNAYFSAYYSNGVGLFSIEKSFINLLNRIKK